MASLTARPARTLLVTAAVTATGLGVLALPAQAGALVERPDRFTSAFTVQAVGTEVVGMDGSSGVGDSSATATFSLQLNSELDVICFSISTQGVTPPYMSPARTSTHIHEAAPGSSGPPRIVFPDPSSATNSDPRTSTGCLQGPFATGVAADNGDDTGSGFTVAELEANPADYYVDIHTSAFVPGSVRGQVRAAAAPAQAAPPEAAPQQDAPQQAAPQADAGAPQGGVSAGFGGLAGSGTTLPAFAALAAALIALGAGLTGTTLARAGTRRR